MTLTSEEAQNPPTKIVSVGKVVGNVNIGDSPEYNISSAINDLLKALSNKPFEIQIKRQRPPAETIVKINHNNLKSKSHIIKQYLDDSKKIEEAYAEIEALIPFGKDTILSNLNNLYYEALDSLEIDYLICDIDIEKIRENSDFIIEFIIQKLKNTAFESKNTPYYKEHIERGINVVVAHAFIECIIMENPNHDS